MKRLSIALAASAFLSIFYAQLSTAFAQGSLTPSAPPAPAMLTLTQVEPRTPVDATHTPGNGSDTFIISQPGSYYLTTNIYVPGLWGIGVATNNVTVDLQGFSIIGPNSGGGIQVLGNRVAVKNGMIRNCNSLPGIDASVASGCDFENLNVISNYAGIRAGTLAIVRNCIASQSTGGEGIGCYSGDVITGNLADHNNNGGIYIYGTGNRIEDNEVFSNSFYGILPANISASNNVVVGNSICGPSPIIAGPHWIMGPLIDSTSVGTNSNPNANYNMDQ